MNRSALPDVVLLHGLWMRGIVMAPLAARLKARGFRCHLFNYPSRSETLGMHAARLRGFAREVAQGAPVHLVGHSFGGLVALAVLGGREPPPVAGVLMLGTPVRGCMAGLRLARAAPGRWMLGKSRAAWREGGFAAWDGRAPLGIIAGSRPFGLGRVLGRLPGVNDGVVRLEETEIEGMSDRIVLPVGHTELIFSRRVAKLAADFLAHGRFSRDA